MGTGAHIIPMYSMKRNVMATTARNLLRPHSEYLCRAQKFKHVCVRASAKKREAHTGSRKNMSTFTYGQMKRNQFPRAYCTARKTTSPAARYPPAPAGPITTPAAATTSVALAWYAAKNSQALNSVAYLRTPPLGMNPYQRGLSFRWCSSWSPSNMPLARMNPEVTKDDAMDTI